METFAVNIRDGRQLCRDVLRAGLVPFVRSHPGMGKSYGIAMQLAKDLNLEYRDERLTSMDAPDLLGAISVRGDKAKYLPFDSFPLEGDELPRDKQGWLICLDEFNAVRDDRMRAAAYKLVLDKMVGQKKLHHRAPMIAMGNMESSKGIVSPLPTPLRSRLVHVFIKSDFKIWYQDFAVPNDIDHRVIGHLQFSPDDLNSFDPASQDHSYACERTWEFVSKVIKPKEKIERSDLPLLTGILGEAKGQLFYNFLQISNELPSREELIKNPETVELPDNPALQYAICTMIAGNMTVETANQYMKLVNRMQIDFQVFLLKQAIRKFPKLLNHDSIKAWRKKNAKELANA